MPIRTHGYEREKLKKSKNCNSIVDTSFLFFRKNLQIDLSITWDTFKQPPMYITIAFNDQRITIINK
jgi:hypothetical protein